MVFASSPLFGAFLGRRAIGAAMLAQLGGTQTELGHAAVHDGGGGGDIAVGSRQFGQLPQQARHRPAATARAAARGRSRVRRQTFALRLGKTAWLELAAGADVLDAEKIVEILASRG